MAWYHRQIDNGPGYFNVDMDEADNCIVLQMISEGVVNSITSLFV